MERFSVVTDAAVRMTWLVAHETRASPATPAAAARGAFSITRKVSFSFALAFAFALALFAFFLDFFLSTS
jgi:hypothetical protein